VKGDILGKNMSDKFSNFDACQKRFYQPDNIFLRGLMSQFWELWKAKLAEFETWRDEERSVAILIYWDFLREQFVKEIPKSEREYLLDIGSGTGVSIVSLAKNTKCIGIGLDPIQSSLRILKRRGKKENVIVHAIRAIGENVPIKSKSIETVIITGTLDHVLDANQVMQESKRVLKEDCSLFIQQGIVERRTVNHSDRTHLKEFTGEEICGLLKENDFIIKKIKIFYRISKLLPFLRILMFIPRLYNLVGKLVGSQAIMFIETTV